MCIEKISQFWPGWQIVEEIGEGSFGKVYKGIHKEHTVTTYAAVKVISIPQSSAELASLRAEGMSVEESKTYFQGIVNDVVSEIQLMASLKGTSNIVCVEDFKILEKEDKIGYDIFIRMELLTPFNEYVVEHPMNEERVIKLGIDICSALELCEQRNVIHRDVKPENIFVSDFGDFKIGDFGIAKDLEKTNLVLSSKGTYNYIAPEIAMGRHYDSRVDIYSLGVVLYKLLNNNRLPFIDPYAQQIPYQERKNAVDRRLQGEQIPGPVNASSEMAEVIMKACAYDPEQRFGSPSEFKKALLVAKENLKQRVKEDEGLDATLTLSPPKHEDVDETVKGQLLVEDETDKTEVVRIAPKVKNKEVVSIDAPKEEKNRRYKSIMGWGFIVLFVLIIGGCLFWIFKPEEKQTDIKDRIEESNKRENNEALESHEETEQTDLDEETVGDADVNQSAGDSSQQTDGTSQGNMNGSNSGTPDNSGSGSKNNTNVSGNAGTGTTIDGNSGEADTETGTGGEDAGNAGETSQGGTENSGETGTETEISSGTNTDTEESWGSFY